MKTKGKYLKGFAPMSPAPLLFGGVVAKRRSGYVSVGEWLGLALRKHQGETKKGSQMKLESGEAGLPGGLGKARKLALNEANMSPTTEGGT